MDKDDTQIIQFRDHGDSVFTLKKGKSYNTTKSEKTNIFGKKTYYFTIINCVSVNSLVLKYHDKECRNLEYSNFVDRYIKFNNMTL